MEGWPTGRAMAARRSQLTLSDFVQQRLGGGSDLDRLGRMFSRSFGAGSFTGFWRYWNPVYSYYLHRFCYRPLRRWLPRPLAFVATFACSGFFLHDLPFWWGVAALKTRSLPVPMVTLWFATMAVFALAEASLGVEYSALPFRARVALNVLRVAVAGLAALALATLVR